MPLLLRPLTFLAVIFPFAGFVAAKDVEIVVHRGANHLAPENTFAAANKCVDLGVDYVEVDVRTSRDGVFYVLHDSTLDRTTDGSGPIAERESPYIDSLDAGSWFSPDFTGEKVPQLESFLRTFKGKIKVYFDVKDADLEKLLDLVYRTGFGKDCFFWFSEDERAREIRRLDPEIPLKMNAVDVDGLRRILPFNPQIIEYRLPHLTPEFTRFCRENNLKLMAHALGKGAEKLYGGIIGSAADMVNLDRPALMLEQLAAVNEGEPIRHTCEWGGEQREYFVRLPAGFDGAKHYQVLVTVHGGGGNGRNHFLAGGVHAAAREAGFPVLVVSPSFSNEDFEASRFPALGEGDFLLAVLDQLGNFYQTHDKILLTGYSRGGQFSHRFALAHPGRVAAVAPCSAGTWTTPDGRLLIEGYGEVKDPGTFLSDPRNREKIPERLLGLFNDVRVAGVAGLKAESGARRVPFRVMCGSLDTRFAIAQDFARSLAEAGYRVETEWPRTPHGSRNKPEFRAEFEKYSQGVVDFFVRQTHDP